MAFKMKGFSPFTKKAGPETKQIDVDELADKDLKKKRDNWEPAFAGADHSQEELDKMTKEEIDAYYN